jgi:hypothetical protein
MIVKQQATTAATGYRRGVAESTESIGGHVVAVSSLKGRPRGFANFVVPLSANPRDIWRGPENWKGDCAFRVLFCDAHMLGWEFHQRAFAGISVTLVGHNAEFSGVRASSNWAKLKKILSRHRRRWRSRDEGTRQAVKIRETELQREAR